MPITITEALAEIKTIGKRMSKKQEFILSYLARQDAIRDPLERDGGSAKAIAAEQQAIADLQSRVVALRRGIQSANEETTITVNGVGRSIADWLVWRRDVAPGQQQFFSQLRSRLEKVRNQARQTGASVVSTTAAEKPTDWVVNLNEQQLAKDSEQLEDTLGQLDGQLSLKNATVLIKE